MAKQTSAVEMRLRAGKEHVAIIDGLRALVAKSGDNLLLAEGPPEPDAELVELGAEALRHLRHEQELLEVLQSNLRMNDRELLDDMRAAEQRARVILRRMGKLPARTGAGVFAKAGCVAFSKTGSEGLSRSLARDLVNNPALRAIIWPAQV